ncbi:O-antigen ligase family protein [Aeromonas hydrophila]|uniref:O-antigen ligase family protein n=2 Tax=Aeromonas hydrophila TaxID=644 RepID=UPI002F427AFD
MMVINYSEKIRDLTKWCYILTIFFTFNGLFFLENGKTLLSNFIVISIFMGGISYVLGYRNVGLRDRRILWVFISYAVMIFVNRMIHGDQYGVMRAILYIVLFSLFIPREKYIIESFFSGAVCGGIGLGAISIWQYFGGLERADGFTNAVLFSQACDTIFIIVFFIFHYSRGKSLFRMFSVISMIMSLCGLYLSQSRGVWLSLILLVVFYISVKSFKKPFKYVSIITALIVLSFFGVQKNNVISQRIDSAVYDLKEAESGQYGGSWGLRLVVWKSAWLAFMDNPFFGVGTDGYDETRRLQSERGLVSPLVLHPALTHAHSQYMQSLMIRGGVGAVFLLVFLFFPLYLTTSKGLISPVVFLCLSFAICGLSDVPFEHQNVLYLYLVSVVVFFFSEEMNNRGRCDSNHHS